MLCISLTGSLSLTMFTRARMENSNAAAPCQSSGRRFGAAAPDSSTNWKAGNRTMTEGVYPMLKLFITNVTAYPLFCPSLEAPSQLGGGEMRPLWPQTLMMIANKEFVKSFHNLPSTLLFLNLLKEQWYCPINIFMSLFVNQQISNSLLYQFWNTWIIESERLLEHIHEHQQHNAIQTFFMKKENLVCVLWCYFFYQSLL